MEKRVFKRAKVIVAMIMAACCAFGGVSVQAAAMTALPAPGAALTPGASAGLNLKGKRAGSSVVFGRFEQDGNAANGSEPIEWVVLANDGTKALVLSKNILENLAYLHTYENITWERSDVRSWMNGTFYNSAFTDAEKAAIISVTNSNPASNSFYGGVGLPGGNDTVDKVFALSAYEAGTYLGANAVADWNAGLQACPTPYATMRGCWTHPSSRRGFWWLRTPGNGYGNFTSVVQDHGGVVSHVGVSAGEGARPAMWISY